MIKTHTIRVICLKYLLNQLLLIKDVSVSAAKA